MTDKPQSEIRPVPKARVNPLDGGFKYSASQIGTQRDCFTKWFMDQTLGLPRQDTASTLLGKKVHSELEAWLRDKKPPSHPRAKAMLPMLPLPSPAIKVEHEFRLLTPPGVVRGFMDVFIPNVHGVDLPYEGPPDPAVPLVMDHKTTSNLFYAKTKEDLLTDPQAILYGMAARVFQKEAGQEIPEFVDLNWNYVQTRGDPETKSVRLRQSLQIMEDGLGPIIEEAATMRTSLVGETNPADLPHNLKSCEKFGGCQFLEFCPHVNRKAVAMSTPETPADPVEESNTLARLRKLNASKLSAKAPAAEPAASPPASPPKAVVTVIETVVEPAPPVITPEPKLEAIPTEGVHEAPIDVEILPPDAPAPKKRGRPAKAVEVVEAPIEAEPEQAIKAGGTALVRSALIAGNFGKASRIAYAVECILAEIRNSP
jgi:hypothetical protein